MLVRYLVEVRDADSVYIINERGVGTHIIPALLTQPASPFLDLIHAGILQRSRVWGFEVNPHILEVLGGEGLLIIIITFPQPQGDPLVWLSQTIFQFGTGGMVSHLWYDNSNRLFNTRAPLPDGLTKESPPEAFFRFKPPTHDCE